MGVQETEPGSAPKDARRLKLEQSRMEIVFNGLILSVLRASVILTGDQQAKRVKISHR